MTPRHYILNSTQQRANVVRFLSAIEVEQPVEVVIRPFKAKRSLEQNDKLHALLSDIAQQKEWAGQWLDVETWKRLMVAGWERANKRSAEMFPSLDGHGFDVVYRRTSKMTMAEVAELITYAEAWAVDNGVVLHAQEQAA